MQYDVITLFGGIVEDYCSYSIMKRGIDFEAMGDETVSGRFGKDCTAVSDFRNIGRYPRKEGAF